MFIYFTPAKSLADDPRSCLGCEGEVGECQVWREAVINFDDWHFHGREDEVSDLSDRIAQLLPVLVADVPAAAPTVTATPAACHPCAPRSVADVRCICIFILNFFHKRM